ncbi:unnamed protein product [Spodoptera exigua]|nr:unnamed protein product [Spodoptera exigua]
MTIRDKIAFGDYFITSDRFRVAAIDFEQALAMKFTKGRGHIIPRHKFDQVRFVAGILKTRGTEPIHDDIEQWRKLERVYTQKFYRFPAFNLAVVVLTKPWVFNTYVNKIPYATKEQDFDGVCTATAVKATRSWSTIKYLYTQEVEMVPREECEKILCRSCRLFMCTVFNNRNQYAYSDSKRADVSPDGQLAPPVDIRNNGRVKSALATFWG